MSSLNFFRLFFLFYLILPISSIYSQENKSDPLSLLREGNDRFCNNQMQHKHQDIETVRMLETGQHPFAVIISCSDSRVTPEIVFDQGLGDLFSIRTAGNVMSDYEEGSIEYAVEHLNTKFIVVLGHQGCGAVKAFLNYVEDQENSNSDENDNFSQMADHVQSIINKIKSEDEEIELLKNGHIDYDQAIRANIINGVKQLRTSDPILAKKYRNNEINIVGAVYHIDNGVVEFLDL